MEGWRGRVRDHADRGGLPLVRDGELLPRRRPRAPRAAQPGDLAAQDSSASGSGPCRTLAGLRQQNVPAWRATSPRIRSVRARREDEHLRHGDEGGREADARAPARRARAPWAQQVVDRTSIEKLVDGGLVERVDGEEYGSPSRAQAPRRRRHGRAPSPEDRTMRLDGVDGAQARDPATGRRGVRRDRPAGRVQGARRTARLGRVLVDGAQRALGAGAAACTARPASTSAGRVPTENGYRIYTEELVVANRGRPA